MITRLPRSEFLDSKFDYSRGDAIGLYGNTGSGKTYLGYQLAQVCMRQNPGMRFTAYQPKPGDSTTMSHAQNLGLEITPSWPPRKRLLSAKPAGYVHWPPHITNDADADVQNISKAFKSSLNAEYWKGNVLSFVDDELLLLGKYRCATELEQYLIAGRSNDAGLMFSLQAPKGNQRAGVSSFHFSQPVHMFWNRENVESNREKYGEVACGIDPRTIMDVVANLTTYKLGEGNVSETLYIDRRGPYACVISPW